MVTKFSFKSTQLVNYDPIEGRRGQEVGGALRRRCVRSEFKKKGNMEDCSLCTWVLSQTITPMTAQCLRIHDVSL